MLFSRWRSRWLARQTRRIRQLQTRQLRLEVLEERTLLDAVRWINPNGGDWSVPSNWSTGTLPGPADDAIVEQQGITITHSVGTDAVRTLTSQAAFEVSGGSLTLLGDSALSDTLAISGGTLVNGGTTSVGGPLTWTAGTLSGSGRVRANGGLAISSVSSKVLDGGTLDNAGDAAWEAGSISFSNGAAFNNLAGAVFVASGPRLVNAGIGASPTFTNAGLFREHTGTGTLDGITFVNTGDVEVENGSSLSLSAELHCSGSFVVASGGQLTLGNGRHIWDALSSVTGSGTVAFIGGDSSVAGTYNVSGNTLVSAGVVSFLADAITATATLNGGTLTGPGNVTITESLTWMGGTMSGVGRTTARGATVITGDTMRLSDRTLDIAGSAIWNGGTITLVGAAINNMTGATFDAQANTALSGTGTFSNYGTVRKSGATGNLDVDVAYVNAGRVEVQTGTLNLSSGSDSTGSFTVASGATLDFGIGTHNLRSDSSITSDGTVRFMSLTGSQSGTTNVAGSYTTTGDTTIQDEIVNFFRDVTLPTLTLRRFQSDAVLGGPADVTVTGLLTWMGATMSGSGRTRANGGIVTGTFEGGLLVGRTFDNAGTAIWTDQGLALRQGATFNNLAGATFLMEYDQQDEIGWSQSDSSFNNAGTFIKLASNMETVISANFTNSGTVEVRTGYLTLSGGSTSSGSYEVDSGAFLTFGSGSHTLTPESRVTGAGSVWFRAGSGQTSATTIGGVYDVSGTTTMISGSAEFFSAARMGSLSLGSFSNDPPGTITGSGDLSVTGAFSWTAGTLAGSGRLRANGGISIASQAGAELRLDGRVLENAGVATWIRGNLSAGDGATINNLDGATWDVQGDVSLVGFGVTAPTFHNAGALRKSAGTGTTAFNNVAFNNTGAVEVQSGTLSLTGQSNSSGSFTAGTGATLVFNSGLHYLDPNSRITGGGSVGFANDSRLDGSTVQIAGTYDVSGNTNVTNTTVEFGSDARAAAFSLAGTVTGSGDLTITGLFTWTDGIMSGTGRTLATGGVALSGNSVKHLDGRRFNNAGMATWTGDGYLTADNGAVFRNLEAAVLDIQSAQSLSGGSSSAFINAGVVRKSSLGQMSFSIPFTNRGTVEIRSGNLVLQNASSTGSFTVAKGAQLEFDSSGPAFNMQPGSSVTGPGTIVFTTGTVFIDGTYDVGTTIGGPFATVDFEGSARTAVLTPGDVITGSGTLTVTALLNWGGGTMSGSGRTVVTGRTVLGGGDEKILDGRTFDNSGTAVWNGFGGSLVGRNGALFNNLQGATFDDQTDSDFLFYWDGIGATPVFNNAGVFRKSSATGVSVISGEFSNAGTIDIQTGALRLKGPFTNFNATSGTLTGGTYLLKGTLQFTDAQIITNTASILLDGTAARMVNQNGADALAQFTNNSPAGGLTLRNGGNLSIGAVTNAGVIDIGARSTLTVEGTYEQRAGMTLLEGGFLTAVGTFNVLGGTLAGSGTITANVTNAGLVAPGATRAFGILTILGSYTQTAQGTLGIEIGGLKAGTGFDQLIVTGVTTLDGTINISLTNGFTAKLGDSFQILNFGSRTGDFANEDGLALGDGLRLDPQYSDSSLTLVTVAGNNAPPGHAAPRMRSRDFLAQLRKIMKGTCHEDSGDPRRH